MSGYFDVRKVITRAHDSKGVHKADVIKADHINLFISAEQTGTGASQNIAHGLGVVPSVVLIALTEHGAVAVDVAEGTHTTTNVVVTVTSGVKFKVLAIA